MCSTLWLTWWALRRRIAYKQPVCWGTKFSPPQRLVHSTFFFHACLLSWAVDFRIIDSGGDSSVGSVSDYKARRNTYAGSNPRCGNSCFTQSTPRQTATVCKRGHQHLYARKQFQTLAPVPCFWNTKTLYTLIETAAIAALVGTVRRPELSARDNEILTFYL